jgi:hypothetical protein
MRPIPKRRLAGLGIALLASAASAPLEASSADVETATVQVAATTSELRVEASSVTPIQGGYVQVDGVMSATLSRDDGSEGGYRVPVTLLYPQHAARCSGAAVVDVINSVFFETFEGVASDAFLFPAARLVLGADFLRTRGYVYAHAQWNKLVLERQRAAGTLPDQSLLIDRGTDGHVILRDLSAFLRGSGEFDGPGPAPCVSRNVVSFGYSQTGMLLRQFYFAELNTALAEGPSFDDDLVFEASLHGGPGGRCRSLTDGSPWFAYTFESCGGATPPAQGPVVTINAETDLQLMNAWRARTEDAESSHYRVFELAASAHIPTPLLPLKLSGLRPSDQADQNYAETFPVYRAMVEHLLRWADGSGSPPPSVVVRGKVKRVEEALFGSASWGSDNNLVFVPTTGEDGNGLGGVRLPHVRTELPGGEQVGGPLGVYRGAHCNNDPTVSTFILDCRLSGDLSIYNMAGGTFTPYTVFRAGRCADYYPTHESYTEAVTAAAEHAAASGWILAAEIDSLVTAAEQNAAVEWPGCVAGTG